MYEEEEEIRSRVELGLSTTMPNLHLLHLHGLHPAQPLLTAVHNSTTITAVHCTLFPIRTLKPTAPIHQRAMPLIGAKTIRCMANPRRVKMVAKQIHREISDMLITDKVLQYAILPEVSLGADQYLSSLTTISDVEVSNDLQVVKVYVSVFGDERGRDVAIAGLKSKAKYVRRTLGKRMNLRLTPEIRFIADDSLERGSRVIALLDKIKAKSETAENQDDGLSDSFDSPQEDDLSDSFDSADNDDVEGDDEDGDSDDPDEYMK